MPDSLTDDVLWLVGNRKFADWRAIIVAAPARVDRLPLMPYAAEALGVARGRHRARGAALAAGSMSVADAAARMIETNFDGIPGPTHNYAGLARGNLAAERNAQLVANPREAALQGLAKMRDARLARVRARRSCRRTSDPSCLRCAHWALAERDAQAIEAAARSAPRLLAACSSAAAMWAANAATISASADTADGRVHFTPANLVSHFHRSIEAGDDDARAARDLRRRFAASSSTIRCLPRRSSATRAPRTTRGSCEATGAASISSSTDACALDAGASAPDAVSGAADPRGVARRSPAGTASPLRARCSRSNRRTRSMPACSTTTSSPSAQGTLLFCHAARVCRPGSASSRRSRARSVTDFATIVVDEADVTLDEAVDSYLFNSQLLPRPDGRWLLLAPADVREHPRVRRYVDRLVASGGPIAEVADARPAPEHAQRRRPGVPAPARAAERRGTRDASARAFSSMTRWRTSSKRGSASTTAIGSHPPTSPIRSCSTSRGARWTS